MSEVSVWREIGGSVEKVGFLRLAEEGLTFAYDPQYAGHPVSVSLPVRWEAHGPRATENFFRGLIPEGAAYRELARTLRAGEESYLPFLERLRDESIGALLFSVDDEPPYRHAAYLEAPSDLFDDLTMRPIETAVSTLGKTRLSLTGAMAKVGLYRDRISGRWFLPVGGAPSTHIVKVANSAQFPNETVNEALCLRVAARCGLPAARAELIPMEKGAPLLAVERFDRVIDGSSRMVDGMPAPHRLHQEDFAQAISTRLKYEPTDGNYLNRIVYAARSHCANAFGEGHLLFEYTLFNYLIGNCDNHLKNYALLYDSDWAGREVAPLYDVISTVLYPEIYLEMGVSFGGDRRIDRVTREAIEGAAARCGLPKDLVWSTFEELGCTIPGALEEEADKLAHEGYPEAKSILAPILCGVEGRFRI